MRFRLLLATCLSLTVVSCSGQPASSPSAGANAAATVSGKGLIKGSVLVPARLVAAVLPTGGGNVIPTGGGNVIPTGGGNVIPTGGGNALPLANAKVFLADAAGQPYPALDPVQTDANGQFTFPAVPADHSFVVVAQAHDTKLNKDVTLQTLVKSSELGATASISVPSSFVTMAVTDSQGSELGNFNAATFRTATEAAAKGLTDDDVDVLSDRSAVLKKIDDLAASIAELKSALDEIRKDLKDIKNSLDQINKKLDDQAKATPAPQQPAGQFPPPPGGMQPPLGGQFPPPGGGMPQTDGNRWGCTPPRAVSFTLSGSYTGYPLRLEIMNGDGNPITSATFVAPGSSAQLTVPTTCANTFRLRDAGGTIVATAANYVVPSSGATQVTLPF